MPTTNVDWDPALYDHRHSFIWKAGAGLVELLHPQAGERILDVGCGTGHLTRTIAQAGVKIIGIDNSERMIAAARDHFPTIDFQVMDVADLHFTIPFDAIFSNATLHWVTTPERAIRGMRRVLRKGGRLVLEMGGHGNIATILDSVLATLKDIGMGNHGVEPFVYFPRVSQYTTLLEANGFEVRYARLFDRPTPLDGEDGLRSWIRQFKEPYVKVVPAARREEFFGLVEQRCRATLKTHNGWRADYRRLQVVAVAM